MAKATDELHWRETYFILFPRDRRPQLQKVTNALTAANARYQLENLAADESGLLQSLMVESHEDHAAIEISYEVGEGVIEQNLEWAKQLQADLPADQLQEMIKADARLDVAHFERVPASGSHSTDQGSTIQGSTGQGSTTEGLAGAGPTGIGSLLDEEFGAEEENFDMLDPICLLTVVEALSHLTNGLTFDPASGAILS